MANIEVRYFSKGGKTEKIAKAIARGAGVEALSVTEEPELKENTDLLFLGGAPYANIMAPELKA
ncbi:MAG: flavodoxin family protein, partial [Clostridia bacterium]|nr:flavodoxin family protein [Clostridia bacterium]